MWLPFYLFSYRVGQLSMPRYYG